MKKIGIITCSKEPNYGACLQALATQHKVKELGYDAELMNYTFMEEKLYSPLKQKTLRSFVSSALFYPLRKSLHTAFLNFRNKNMKYSSKPLFTPEDFACVVNDYDAFLIGSDQVWNPDLGIDTDITLLRFYENGPRRLSYASSFGVSSLSKECELIYKIALDKFEYISTREETGKNLVNNITHRQSVVSLDPTMLLDADMWSKYEEKSGLDKPYVLIYDMRHSPMVIDTAKKLAKTKGCKVVALSRIIIHDKQIRTLYGISPGQFLDLFKNAEAVVTDSFHGTVFSIIYQKEFYSYCSERGMKISSRITDILKSLGLSERLIHDGAEVTFSNILYDSVMERLEKMREVSMGYLKKILANEEILQDDCITGLYVKEKAKTLKHVGEKEEDACCGCGMCAAYCPFNAIKMEVDDEGFMYPRIDENVCVSCGKCLKVCAFENTYCDEFCNTPVNAYIARAEDDKILKKSASGGIFTLLSDIVLSKNGKIYGAVYDDNGYVHHLGTGEISHRDRICGSKYVQSDMNGMYEKIKDDLQNGLHILFTGTPCQTAAVHSYLSEVGANMSNLVLCDIICHGVTSPAVWKKYLDYITEKVGKIISINTRDKKYGSGYNMTICGDKSTYHKKSSNDPFIKLFQLNGPLRSSCFACPMKRIERISDITIGDFQKVSQYFPKYADNKGVSVVFTNTEKGASLFEQIKSNLNYEESSLDAAMQVNLYTQIENRNIREMFFEKFKNDDFIKVLKFYTTLGTKNKIIYLLKEIAKKCIGR